MVHDGQQNARNLIGQEAFFSFKFLLYLCSELNCDLWYSDMTDVQQVYERDMQTRLFLYESLYKSTILQITLLHLHYCPLL